MDPDARPAWLSAEAVHERFGLVLDDHADPRHPDYVRNRLTGDLRREWLLEDCEALAARLTRAPANDTPEQRLRREISERLDRAAKVRADEKREARRG